MKYQSGDIIMVRPRGLLFWMVRKFTSGKFGHIGLVVGSVHDHVLIIEATANGVDINDLVWRKVYKEDYSILRITNITDQQKADLVKECLTFVGMTYDKKAWFNFIIGKTWFGSDKQMYCSEMIYRALVRLKIIEDKHHPEKITPHNLYELLRPKLQFIGGDHF